MEAIKRKMTAQVHKKKFQRSVKEWRTHWNVLNVKGTILKKMNISLILCLCLSKYNFSLDTF